MTLNQLRYLFQRYGIHPNKRLGQNFLYDPNMTQKMLRSMEITKNDTVIEIGPGAGVLTEGFSERAKEVWAIEIDRGLARLLKERLGDRENLHLIHEDFLEWDFDQLSSSEVILAGNLPYQISSPFIEFVIGHRKKIAHVWVTVQWEFAERLIAKPGTRDGSSLSCFVQMYLEPEILFRVPRTVFYPSPEVDSAFVSLTIRPKPLVAVKDERVFFDLIRKGYAHRRKTLMHILTRVPELGIGRDTMKELFEQMGLSFNARAEELTLEDWARLSEKMGARE